MIFFPPRADVAQCPLCHRQAAGNGDCLWAAFLRSWWLGPVSIRISNTAVRIFFFSSGVNKGSYLWGRFFGAFCGNGLIYLGVFGRNFPGQLGFAAFHDGTSSFFLIISKPCFVLALPNLLFAGAICFAFVTVTRQQVTAYVAVIVALTLYMSLTTIQMLSDHRVLGPLADPFGVVALDEATRYWSVFST